MMPTIDAAISGHGRYEGRAYLFVGDRYYRYLWPELHADPKTLTTPSLLSAWQLGLARVTAAVNHPRLPYAYFFGDDGTFARYDWERGDGYTVGSSIEDFGLPDTWQHRVDAAVEGGGEFAGTTLLFRSWGERGDAVFVTFTWPDEDMPAGGHCSHEIRVSELGLLMEYQDGIDAAMSGEGPRSDSVYFFKGETYVRYLWGKGPADGSYPAPLSRGRWFSAGSGTGTGGAASGGSPITIVGHLDVRGGIGGPYRGSVYFDTDSEQLRPEDQAELRKLDEAQDDLHRLAATPLTWTLTGWADPRTSHRLGDNAGLSARRAGAVQDFWGARLDPLPGPTDLPSDAGSASHRVDGLTLKVVGGGVDPASRYTTSMHPSALAIHRRVDIWGPPIPRGSDPPPPPRPPSFTDTLWDARIPGGAGGGPVEGFKVEVRSRTERNVGSFMCFASVAGVGGGVIIASDWTTTASDTPLTFSDFEGPCWHISGHVQGTQTAVEVLRPATHRLDVPMFIWASTSTWTPPKTLDQVLAMLGGGASVSVGLMILSEVT